MTNLERAARAIGKAYAMREWGRSLEEAEFYMGERQWSEDWTGPHSFKIKPGARIHEKFSGSVWRCWEEEARAALVAVGVSPE